MPHEKINKMKLRQEKKLKEKLRKEELRREKKLKEKLRKEELRKKELKLRRLKRNAASKASRERAKILNEETKQKCTDLQNEKTKLLEENKALIRKWVELLGENSSLKSELRNMNSIPMKEENSNEPDVKRPLFVSIPLFKLDSFQGLRQSNDVDVMGSKQSGYESLSEFSLFEWLDNPEMDSKNDRLFSLLDSNGVSWVNNKHIQVFDECFMKKLVPHGQPENTKGTDDLFGSRVRNYIRPKFVSEVSKFEYRLSENSFNIISNNADINQTFLKQLQQWTFDDLYEASDDVN